MGMIKLGNSHYLATGNTSSVVPFIPPEWHFKYPEAQAKIIALYRRMINPDYIAVGAGAFNGSGDWIDGYAVYLSLCGRINE